MFFGGFFVFFLFFFVVVVVFSQIEPSVAMTTNQIDRFGQDVYVW